MAPSTDRGQSPGPEVEDQGFWQMGTESQEGLEGDTPRDLPPLAMDTTVANKHMNHLV